MCYDELFEFSTNYKQIGTVSDAHCEKDILDAKALGADAFALNINTVTASWATGTTALLFKWAAAHDFKLLLVINAFIV